MRWCERTDTRKAGRFTVAILLAGGSLPVEATPPEPAPRRAPDAPPQAQPVVRQRPRQTLWERVQDAWDRGTRRVTDEPTYQIQRLEDARDERLGRIPTQRPTERFREDYDRRLRVEGLAARSPRAALQRADRFPRVSADPATASMAWMLEDDQRLLAKLKADYERGIETLARERDRLRAAAPAEADRAAIDRRFEQQRAELAQKYENQRRAILGWPPASQPSPTTPQTAR